MRRKDREITDLKTMLEILEGCTVLRIGLADGDFPYIVPMNFAYILKHDRPIFYIHGAKEGRKYDLMQKNGRCSFEADIPLKMECFPDKGVITMRYQSVMGRALIRFLEDEEKKQAMDEILLQRYPETRAFPYSMTMLSHTAVAELTVLDWTAKVNPLSQGKEG